MKQYGPSIMEFFAVSDGLGHSSWDIQPLHPFDLDVEAGETAQVRHLPITLSASSLYRISVVLKNTAQFQLTGAAFSLRTFSTHN